MATVENLKGKQLTSELQPDEDQYLHISNRKAKAGRIRSILKEEKAWISTKDIAFKIKLDEEKVWALLGSDLANETAQLIVPSMPVMIASIARVVMPLLKHPNGSCQRPMILPERSAVYEDSPVRIARLQLGLSTKEFGALSGCDRRFVTDTEIGARKTIPSYILDAFQEAGINREKLLSDFTEWKSRSSVHKARQAAKTSDPNNPVVALQRKLDMTLRGFAKYIGKSHGTLSAVIYGLSAQMPSWLQEYFESNGADWLTVQTQYINWRATCRKSRKISIGYGRDHRVSLLASTPTGQSRIIEPVRVRLIRKLLEIFPDANRNTNGDYVFELHHPTIAKSIQTTRESTSRLLIVMQKEGLVTIEKKGHKNLVSVKNKNVLITELARLTTGKSLHD